MKSEERVVKIAKLFGNGAHVFVPRDWAGEQIILIKQQKKNVEERILEVIKPYLANILGVYLYGSYARGEQTEFSDIDLMVITNKKIKIREQGFEIICLEEKNIKKAIKLAPLLMHSIISESKPLINSNLLEELRLKYKMKIQEFNEFLSSCKRMIKVNKEFLKSEKDYVSGDAVIYSLILRLRGIYIIHSLLNGTYYSYKGFKKWISEKLPNIDFNLIYDAYVSAKHNLKIKDRIKAKDLKLLIRFFEDQILILENAKKKKKT